MSEHSEEGADAETTDPFSPENIGAVQFIELGRIYDVLMAILGEQNPDKATALLELHREGHIVGPMPHFSGSFVTDDIN